MSEETHKQPWWVETIKTLGLPTTFLVIVLVMVWRGGKWVSSDVIMPLVHRQMEFIDTATKTLSDTQLASSAVQQGQSKGFDNLKQIDDTTTQTSVDVKRILELVKEIEFIIKSHNVKAAE
jgi:hypothetical protein